MQIKGHRTSYLLLAVILPMLLLAILWPARPTTAAPTVTQPVQYVAFIGSDIDIDANITPFVYNKIVRFVRVYYDAQAYIDEAPAQFFPAGTPTDASIRLYKLMVPEIDVTQTISDLAAAIQPVSPTVKMSTDELKFLSHVPDQVIVHGNCNAMDNLTGTHGISFKKELRFSYLPISPTSCVQLYETNGQMVDTIVTQINTGSAPPTPPMYPDIWAEPNYLSSSYMGGHYIFGSGGHIVDGAPGPNVPVSPLTTKGNNVKVVVFDTSPYQFEVGQIVTDVASHSINVRHDLEIPFILPQRGPSVYNEFVDAHGTLVTTPIVEMAPDSDVTLYRVLNEFGVGDGFTLYTAIETSMRDAYVALSNDFNGVIFNYSLGLDIEDAPEHSAFYRLLGYANGMGIVQVGASGNGSAYATAVQPMTLPAAHPNVIGIASLSSNGVIACYSNAGDFAVPGGGAARGAQSCHMEEMVEACAYSTVPANDCATGWDPNSTTTGWAWSVGTSFAAPIATGFVAQIIEAIATARPRSAAPQAITPAEVLTRLKTEATDSENSGSTSGILFGMPVTSAISGLHSEANAAERPPVLLLAAILLLAAFTFLYLGRLRR